MFHLVSRLGIILWYADLCPNKCRRLAGIYCNAFLWLLTISNCIMHLFGNVVGSNRRSYRLITSMSILLIFGPKCTLAASLAATGESRCVCAVFKVRKDGTDRQTDGRQTIKLGLPLDAASAITQSEWTRRPSTAAACISQNPIWSY